MKRSNQVQLIAYVALSLALTNFAVHDTVTAVPIYAIVTIVLGSVVVFLIITSALIYRWLSTFPLINTAMIDSALSAVQFPTQIK